MRHEPDEEGLSPILDCGVYHIEHFDDFGDWKKKKE
jgi:hypothetical protein